MEDFILVPLFAFILLIILYYLFRKEEKVYHSNWHHLISDFSFSSKKFYSLLKEELSKQGITGIHFEQKKLREGNIFSSKRLYLRIHWKDYHFDLCAAPMGKGFFFSWWLIFNLSILELLIYFIPFIGGWLLKKFFTITYYKIDTATTFMKTTHRAVLAVIDELTVEQGVRYMNTEERKPKLNDDIFNR